MTSFTIKGEPFNGAVIELIDQTRLTWAEADAIERATGMTMGEIRYASQTCACGHPVVGHAGLGEEAEGAEAPAEPVVPACASCSCVTPTASSPTRATTALFWISAKRVIPALTYAQFAAGSMGDADLVPEVEVEPDPTPDGDATS